MRNRKTRIIISTIVCDKCGKTNEYDAEKEFSEPFVSVAFSAGYGSRFDGEWGGREFDLCDGCAKSVAESFGWKEK